MFLFNPHASLLDPDVPLQALFAPFRSLSRPTGIVRAPMGPMRTLLD
jgi:hypothetical protein